jgi:uncharacterized membrane protein YeaQ/YmgE (transglycosylase-associated protein family)
MGIFSWIFLGLIAGGLAKFIVPGKEPGGFPVTILIGIAGGILGGFLGSFIGLGRSRPSISAASSLQPPARFSYWSSTILLRRDPEKKKIRSSHKQLYPQQAALWPQFPSVALPGDQENRGLRERRQVILVHLYQSLPRCRTGTHDWKRA